ncbi:MAG TPA: EamA family transporter [Armatimonadota bacterium]|nr:EamA family transporter [Armatimonadota bacterium]
MMFFAVTMTVVIVCSVLGDFFVKRGTEAMKHADATRLTHFHQLRTRHGIAAYLQHVEDYLSDSGLLKNVWLWAGIGLLTIQFAAFMLAMKLAPVTVVVPLMSCTYIGTTLLAKFILHEKVTVQRWSGIAVVMLGVALLGLSTLHPPRPNPGEHGAKAKIQGIQNTLTTAHILPGDRNKVPTLKGAPSNGGL